MTLGRQVAWFVGMDLAACALAMAAVVALSVDPEHAAANQRALAIFAGLAVLWWLGYFGWRGER